MIPLADHPPTGSKDTWPLRLKNLIARIRALEKAAVGLLAQGKAEAKGKTKTSAKSKADAPATSKAEAPTNSKAKSPSKSKAKGKA